jgi:hypothetical protein
MNEPQISIDQLWAAHEILWGDQSGEFRRSEQNDANGQSFNILRSPAGGARRLLRANPVRFEDTRRQLIAHRVGVQNCVP